MTIPTTGPISFGAAAGPGRSISGEFGGFTPLSMNNYYAGSANVPSGTTGNLGPIPTSAGNPPLQFNHFRGSSKIVVELTNHTFVSSHNVIAISFLNLLSSGVLQQIRIQGVSEDTFDITNQWVINSPFSPDTPIAEKFEFRFSDLGGSDDADTGNALLFIDDGIYHVLSASSALDIGLTNTVNGTATALIGVEVRQVGDSLNLANATITLSSEIN